MEIIRNRPTLNGKPFANSFLLLCSTTAPCRTGNYPPIVSCRYAPPLSHAGWETIREQFPAAMLHHYPMPNRKLFANSFLPLCFATVPRRPVISSAAKRSREISGRVVSCRHASPMVPSRTGNYPQTVSCHYAPPLPHAEQETFRKQFPAAMLLHCFMPDEKLSANSFLSLCSTTAPCRTGNFSQAASYHHAPPLPHAGWETIEKRL